MFELKRENYERIAPLLINIDHNVPIVFAVVEGKHLGTIYVDNLDKPLVALVRTLVNYYFLLGEVKEDYFALPRLIFENFAPQEKEVVLFTYSDKNRNILDKLFADYKAIRIQRLIYDFDVKKYTNFKSDNKSLPVEYEVVNLSNEMALSMDLPPFIFDENRGQFGLALRENNKLIGYCYGIFVGNKQVEIDIKINENYRNRGLAKQILLSFIDLSIDKGYIPVWACWPYNESSRKLALKVAFSNQREVVAHFWAENM